MYIYIYIYISLSLYIYIYIYISLLRQGPLPQPALFGGALCKSPARGCNPLPIALSFYIIYYYLM